MTTKSDEFEIANYLVALRKADENITRDSNEQQAIEAEGITENHACRCETQEQKFIQVLAYQHYMNREKLSM